MPDRIIRDELKRSPRYRRLSSDTVRLLFIHLLLTVDSLGNCEASSIAVEDAMHRPIDSETAAKWLGELADADLIRLYQINGKPYLHVPRFRQRLRYVKRIHPRPPQEIECIEINELMNKVRLQTGDSQTTVRLESVEVKRSEEKRSKPFAPNAVAFDAPTGSWLGITNADFALWRAAYPALDIKRELAAAAAWVVANPKNRKANWRRFLTAWFARSQERAPAVVTATSSLKGKLAL